VTLETGSGRVGIPMKWASVVGGLALACLASLSGHAADVELAPGPYKAAPAYIPSYFSWTGYYGGATIGDGFGTATMLDPGAFIAVPGGQLVSGSLRGFLAGGYFGVNYQVGSFVFGFEGDFIESWAKSQATDTLPAANPDIMQVEILWTSTGTGRVGWAVDRLLFFVKGGFAFVNHRDSIAGGNVAVGSATTGTWTFGGGIDWAVTEHWIFRAEYDFMNLPTKAFFLSGPGPAGSANSAMSGKLNEARIGMAYKF
jgi:outer membrane immunogenic protein